MHNDGVNVARLDQHASDERQLKGTRSRGHLRDGTGCSNRPVCAGGEPIDDLVVPASAHHANNKVGGIKFRQGRGA